MKFLEITVSDVFLGEPSEVRIRWENPGFMGQWVLELYQGKKRFRVKVTDSSKREIRGEVVLPYRGKFSFSTLRIASPSPFGLYRNWIILPVKAQGYVYAALGKIFEASWVSPIPLETGGEKNFDTYQEFAEFRSAEGALTSRISWKHYAQTGELLVKFGEGTRGEIRRLQLKDHLQGEEREKMLSELASEAHWCFQQGLQFELLIRSQSFGPGSGAALTRSVLRELALC